MRNPFARAMTVKEYADKYGITIRNVYARIESGDVIAMKRDGMLHIIEKPPAHPQRKANPLPPDDLEEYLISLLWLNSTIIGDSIRVRSKSTWILDSFPDMLRADEWRNIDGVKTHKISSLSLASEMLKMGFTGISDDMLIPPPVKPEIFAAAATESRAAFKRILIYGKFATGNKKYAKYKPAIELNAPPLIAQKYADTLYELGIAPQRKPERAKMHSMKVRYVVHSQLVDIYEKLSVVGQNQGYWQSFCDHINQPPEKYYDRKARKGELK